MRETETTEQLLMATNFEGRFEFVSGQLRDIQLYMHARFDDVDKKIDDLRRDLPDIVAGAVSAVLREPR